MAEVVGEDARSFAVEYFDRWAGKLKQDRPTLEEALVEELVPLMAMDVVEDPGRMDAAQVVAAQAVQASALSADLEAFTESETSARERFAEVRDLFADVRRLIGAGGRDVVAFLIRGGDGGVPENDLERRIYDYLVKGKTRTRLGEQIEAPKEGAEDKALQMLLGLMRIVAEHTMDVALGLPWLADDETEQGLRRKALQLKAGEVGQDIGEALGRAAAIAALGMFGFVVKPPNEVVVGVSHVMGVVVRKGAEDQMHELLEREGNV